MSQQPAADLLAQHRQVQAGVTRLASDALANLWASLDVTDAVAVRDALLDVMPALVSTYGEVAATSAADFYLAYREASGVGGAFTPLPADPPSPAQVEAFARWGVSPLFGGAGPDAALTALSGGMSRLVLKPDRDTIRGSAAVDPAAHGWQRFTRAGSCGFCRMLAGRGTVYRKDTARFASHDHCHCTAAPAFAPGMAVNAAQYAATKRTITEKDRARVREFMTANGLT